MGSDNYYLMLKLKNHSRLVWSKLNEMESKPWDNMCKVDTDVLMSSTQTSSSVGLRTKIVAVVSAHILG